MECFLYTEECLSLYDPMKQNIQIFLKNQINNNFTSLCVELFLTQKNVIPEMLKLFKFILKIKRFLPFSPFSSNHQTTQSIIRFFVPRATQHKANTAIQTQN